MTETAMTFASIQWTTVAWVFMLASRLSLRCVFFNSNTCYGYCLLFNRFFQNLGTLNKQTNKNILFWWWHCGSGFGKASASQFTFGVSHAVVVRCQVTCLTGSWCRPLSVSSAVAVYRVPTRGLAGMAVPELLTCRLASPGASIPRDVETAWHFLP